MDLSQDAFLKAWQNLKKLEDAVRRAYEETCDGFTTTS